MFYVNVFDAVKTRRSIRAYQAKEVENEKLMTILNAARLSPSANNNQPWDFLVVTDPQARDKLKQAYVKDWLAKVPAIIVACARPKDAWSRQDGEEYYKVDVAIAVQSMVLVAHELGLETCYVAAFDEAKVKSTLGIPDDVCVVLMLPVGYPAEQKNAVKDRKGLEQIVHFEQW